MSRWIRWATIVAVGVGIAGGAASCGGSVATSGGNGTEGGPCGATGCNAGLVCENGTCVTASDTGAGSCPATGPVRLAGATSPIAIALDAANVYWVDSALGTVNEVPVCGGSAKTLVTTSALGSRTLLPGGIAVLGSDVYFTTQDRWNPNDGDGAIWKVPVAGGAPTMLVHGLDYPGPIAVTGASMVWIDSPGGTDEDAQVLQAPIDGSSMAVLAPAQNGPLALALGSGTVVWTTSGVHDSERGSINETPMGGGGLVDGIAGALDMPVGVAVAGTEIFWVDQGNPNVNDSGSVMKTPLDPKAAAHPVTLVSGGVPQGIAVDAAYVYWTNSQDWSVNKVPLAGGAPTTLSTKQGAPLAIAVDDTNVYWTTVAEGTGHGSIMKIAK